MAFNLNVVNNCKLIAVIADRFDPSSTQGNLIFTNVDTGDQYTAIMAYDSGTGRARVNVPVANLPTSNGVYTACVEEFGITHLCKPVLIHCDIDCCLVKLTNELMDCSCDCPKCASSLAKAQKIFLLLQSAKSAVELASDNTDNSGYYSDILSKYKKAREICDNSCGCDC